MSEYSFRGTVPDLRGEEETWFGFCQEGRLRIQHCSSCDAYNFYPGAVCRSCTSRALEWHTADGRGVVHTYSWVHRAPPGYEGETPYNVSIIELKEGVRLMSRVLCNEETLRCDLPVTVAFADITADFKVPVFIP
jgi:uncharacterized OB-fold protein